MINPTYTVRSHPRELCAYKTQFKPIGNFNWLTLPTMRGKEWVPIRNFNIELTS